MKPHYRTAPEHVTRSIAIALQHGTVESASGGDIPCRAAGQYRAQEIAVRHGYDWPPEDVPQPKHRELADLERDLADSPPAGRASAILHFRRLNAFELHYEEKCMRYAVSLRGWAAEPSAIEAAEAERAEREEEAHRTAVLERARKLIEQEKTARFEKARKQAEREMEATNGRS